MVLVIMDSWMKAGDNGEYFYDYVMKNHKNDELYFILSKESSDYDRLVKKGFNVIPYCDSRINNIFKNADFILSSKYQKPVNSVWGKLNKDKRIFLNHGVNQGKNNSAGNYFTKKINGDFEYICCVNEHDAHLLKTYYKMNNCKTVVTGFARWDSLLDKNKNHKKNEKPHILITFHWRAGELSKDVDEFKKSDYLKNINSLLNSDEIKTLSDSCEITFMYHAMFSKYKEYFRVPKYIKYGTDMQFQDMLVDADMIVTDFSSNSYEMAVMKKPTLYYIPDVEYVKENMKQYNIKSLKETCIGKFCNTLDELISSIGDFISGDFELSENNNKNIKLFVGDVDTNNCSRIYNFLVSKYKEENKNKEKEREKKTSKPVREGIWTTLRKLSARLDEETMRVIKKGNKRIYI